MLQCRIVGRKAVAYCKKILKGPSELKAENLGAQHMKWKVLAWKIQAPRAILWVPQATGLLLGNSLELGI